MTPPGQTEPADTNRNRKLTPPAQVRRLKQQDEAPTCRLRARASSSSICSKQTAASSSSLIMICSTTAAAQTTNQKPALCSRVRTESEQEVTPDLVRSPPGLRSAIFSPHLSGRSESRGWTPRRVKVWARLPCGSASIGGPTPE